MKYILVFFLFISATSFAATELMYPFAKPAEQARFMYLIKEFRCLVCQNENLADSNASLAKDLRGQIYQMVQAGKTNQEITHYLVDRYGDYILFKPPVNRLTYLLWFGPFFLLILGFVILVFTIKNRTVKPIKINSAQSEQLQQLLNQADDE